MSVLTFQTKCVWNWTCFLLLLPLLSTFSKWYLSSGWLGVKHLSVICGGSYFFVFTTSRVECHLWAALTLHMYRFYYTHYSLSHVSHLCLLAFFPWVGSVMTTLSHPPPYMCPQYYLQYPQEPLSIVLPSRVLATKPLNQWSFQCYVQYPKAGQMLYGKLKIKPMFLK